MNALTPAAGATPPADPIRSVNTFIGTREEGNTFPGASMPFGKAQSSPVGSHYAGYHHDDPLIRGFGHFFLSGAGCWEQGGLVPVLPTTGDVGPGGAFDPADPAAFDHRRYGSPYTHDGEVGEPGHYRVRLTGYGGITVESTATTRVGVERFTFDAGGGNVFVNVGQANDREPVSASGVRVVDDRTIAGTVTAQAFCGGKPYTTWFTTRFDRPFTSFGTWSPEGGAPGSRESAGGGGLRGAWVVFPDGPPVTSATALSQVDAEGADRNLAEVRGRSFDELKRAAQDAWRRELSSVEIETEDADDRTVFCTALYHVLLQPLTGSDADGRYRGFDGRVHLADGWTYYEYFSLWDTYRAQNQLLALLRPDRARDVARSVLAIGEQGGWLPRWAYANQETNTMTGDPVTPFLVDLWRFGALAGLEEEAYEALARNVNGVPPADSPFAGRSGNPNYLEHGFVQYDEDFPIKGQDADPRHGASATLEYALADCSLSIMARALGKDADADALRERGRNHRLLWDPTVTDRGFTGFPRPKRAGGEWLEPFSPQGQDGFHEGTAWQYQWLVQHDVPGLVRQMGGADAVHARLDDFFAHADLVADPAATAREKWVVGPYDYYDQFRYNPNNEPDLHVPWTYALTGQPWKTSQVVRAAQTLFVNAPDGVTGNDDLGQMSAWYVFSALGLYPVVNGTGQFVLHAPRFRRAVVHQHGGRDLEIRAPGADPSVLQHVAALRVDGRASDAVWVDLERVRRGTVLDFSLTTDPERVAWGTSPDSVPPSPCADRDEPHPHRDRR
ncbi:GH92 family glycosyl hydrolase [Umezawaea beigongshangensis]|uniref:GH92 family glycosyl hydrolase n=1 Tax=Umezawaea beigongshangensis TaxID=2780383 RepID=UPI0027DD81AF|nr:GH92 family glycosyl hydrolase [Umezawaea beigongshangensis]